MGQVELNSEQPIEQLGLKRMNSGELFDLVIDGALEWDDEDAQRNLFEAYNLAIWAHAGDHHKDRPYSEHFLRVAARLTKYMNIRDPSVIISAILHDICEDHPLEIIIGSRVPGVGEGGAALDELLSLSERDQQDLALKYISDMFSPKIAEIVSAVTNPPSSEKPTDYTDKLQAYVDKVENAIELPEAWMVKFADWCDNGLSILYDLSGQGEKHSHFRRKYGAVLSALEERFERADIQEMLDDNAKRYVEEQFRRGKNRLDMVA